MKRNATVQKTADLLRNANSFAIDKNKMLKLYEKVFGIRLAEWNNTTVIEMALDIAYQMGRNDEKSGRPTEPPKPISQSIIQLVEYDEPIARIQIPTHLVDLVTRIWEYGDGTSVIDETNMPKVENLNHLL